MASLREIVRKWQVETVRSLLRGIFRVTPPNVFMNAVNERLRDSSMLGYMVDRGGTDVLIEIFCGLVRDDAEVRRHMANRGGLDRILGNLYDIAAGDKAVHAHLIKSEIGDAFRKLYPLALADDALRDYLRAGGIDDLYRYIHDWAGKVGLPLAERAESFGQEGEDLILSRLFDGQAEGFYVDIGAHHPFRFSNTYLLYRRGWRGINIDAMPGSMAAFQQWRPRDINIECMISSDRAAYTYYQYDEPALNTVSAEVVERRRISSPQYRVTNTVTLQARPLAELLSEHVPAGVTIDLMNVDVEGFDLEVLASNDWDRFRPRVIVAELIWKGFSDQENSELYRFLAARGYRLQSKLLNSAIFSQ